MPERVTVVAMAVVAVVAASAHSAAAQIIQGTVRDAITQSPIQGATVMLFDSAGGALLQVETDRHGAFRLVARGRSIVHLKATHFGRNRISRPFRAVRDTSVVLELDQAAFSVDPLRAEAARRSPQLVQSGFYARQERGFGTFMSREAIDSAGAIVLTDLLRTVPGLRVVRAGESGESFDVVMGGGRSMFLRGSTGGGRPPDQPSNRTCFPSIAIGGVVVRRGGREGEIGNWPHLAPPSEVEGIEVYTSGAGLPPQVSGSVSPCGSILIWLRRGS